MSTAAEFDFATRAFRILPPEEAAASCQRGHSCWIDLDTADRKACEAVLGKLGLGSAVIDRAFGPEDIGRYDRHDDCLHVAAASVSMQANDLVRSRLDIIIARQFVVTLHHGSVETIDHVHKTCRQDFEKFAQTLGFIVYEIFDHLIDGYRRAIRTIEGDAGRFQAQIFGEVGDEIFSQFARATRNLLSFRAVLVSTRGVLHKLSSRKSSFIPESTQPFLNSMADSVERLGSDLAVVREILSDTLDLYMSIVSHKTNRVVTRLTVLSVIFLPLTFLCGVYGMNFKHEPELEWRYGYLGFWVIAFSIAVGLLAFMKRRKWL